MWKHILEGFAGAVPAGLTIPKVEDWPWRRLLADAGLVAVFALTSSWLSR
jgi:hypothetical protein